MAEVKEGEEGGVGTARGVVVSVSSREELVSAGVTPLCGLETKRSSRLYNYLYGPYRQHQRLVDCILRLKALNRCVGEDVPGRMLHVGAPCLGPRAGNSLSVLLWYLALLLPFVFMGVCQLCRVTVTLCCCAVVLCLLVSCHSIAIFCLLHNHKIAKRFWFVAKVDLSHYCGRENQVVEVRPDNALSLPFLSAGQRGRVMARLARSPGENAL
ncbi:hypothetical protein ACOMHN_004329 [Nucella lapillus]